MVVPEGTRVDLDDILCGIGAIGEYELDGVTQLCFVNGAEIPSNNITDADGREGGVGVLSFSKCLMEAGKVAEAP